MRRTVFKVVHGWNRRSDPNPCPAQNVVEMKLLRRFLKHIVTVDDGVTVVEYAIMLCMIVLVAIGAILNAGTAHRAFWLDTADQMETITPSGGAL